MSNNMNKELSNEINNARLNKSPKLKSTLGFLLIPAKATAPQFDVPPRNLEIKQREQQAGECEAPQVTEP